MLSWIYEFFDRSVPVILVAQPDQSGEASVKQILPNWVRTVPFLRNGRGCMHMKVSSIVYNASRSREHLVLVYACEFSKLSYGELLLKTVPALL